MRKPGEAVQPEVCDVLVIGGGPAGSAVAALLAARERDVVLLEKDRHPRFHIGESLLPQSLPLLQKLGVLEEVHESIGLLKPGADFYSDTHPNRHQTYYFRKAWDKAWPYAYEVRRSDFDHALFRNAARKGARTRENMRVTSVEFRNGERSRVQALDDEGRSRTWETRLVVDASGRDTLLSSHFGLKQKNRKHNSAALFGHFRGVPRQPGEDEGNICVYWFEHGWFWMIPLRDGTMSVGAVCWPEYLRTRDCPPMEFLQRTIALSPLVSERMRDAELVGAVHATGNFTYFSRVAAGEGYLLVGDAFAFLDPVFSSGVHLALTGAFLAADTVDRTLDRPERAARLARGYERRLRRGMRTFAWFIYRFNTRAFQNLFMAPRDVLRMPEAVTTLLAGDVFRRTPIHWAMFTFRFVYYLTALANLRSSLASWSRRRRNVATSFSGGTTAVDRV